LATSEVPTEVFGNEQLHNPKQAGLILGGLHPKTVLRLAGRGELPFVRIGPHTIRFRDSDLQAFIESKRVST
jgi:excisionase family DNA binding protein